MAANTTNEQLSPLKQLLDRVQHIEALQQQLAEQVNSLRPLLGLLAPNEEPIAGPNPPDSEAPSNGAGKTQNGLEEDRHTAVGYAASRQTPDVSPPAAVKRPITHSAPGPQHQARRHPLLRIPARPAPNGARYTTLANVHDYAIRKKIEQVQQLLPEFQHLNIQQYFDALVRKQGNVEEAAEWLREMENDEPPVPVNKAPKLKQRGVKRKCGVTFEKDGEDEIVVGGRRRCVVKFCLPRERLREALGEGRL